MVRESQYGQETYPSGSGDTLYRLGLLDNADKHTILTPILGITSLGTITITRPDGSEYSRIQGVNVGLTNPGTYPIFSAIPIGLLITQDKNTQTPPDIQFEKIDSFPNQSIIPTLLMLTHEVEERLREFETFVRTRAA